MTEQMETWVAATPGTTRVHVKDPRAVGGWKVTKVSGSGNRRITLSEEERRYNQELVPDYNRQHDPFSNGLLVRTSPPAVGDDAIGSAQYTDEQLQELLQIDSDDVFIEMVRGIESEVVVRRLLSLASTKATMVRFQALEELVDERYHIGKTSQVFRELVEDDARYSNADL